jgi:ABC-type multidrug transport system ATPase subunit
LEDNDEIYIPAKVVTGLHGPNGTGKSTLINILLCFCQPKTSLITIGNIGIGQFSMKRYEKELKSYTI